jgi:hypothetical protein
LADRQLAKAGLPVSSMRFTDPGAFKPSVSSSNHGIWFSIPRLRETKARFRRFAETNI